MTKQEKLLQEKINSLCLNAIEKLNASDNKAISSKPLRTCSAYVIETEKYFILHSYRTNIAFIEKETGILYDVLRYVYGFTSTSAHHIAKFSRDYDKWIYETNRYYPI